jgi:hypothetical protein
LTNYAATHTLTEERDALFLKFAPRDGLWFRRFAAGDKITCCHRCRRIFYESDWGAACPVCGGPDRLFVTRPNMFLATETVREGRGTITRPLRAQKLIL